MIVLQGKELLHANFKKCGTNSASHESSVGSHELTSVEEVSIASDMTQQGLSYRLHGGREAGRVEKEKSVSGKK